MDNLVLIGMPGCGKTTNGIFLARALGLRFVDTDRELMRRHGKKLAELSAEAGIEGFRDLEADAVEALDLHGCVIATGGSVVYRARAMEHLRAIGTVLYLRMRYETLAVRLRDLRARGVSFRAGQTLRDLYDERCPLYERYAHGVLDCDGLKPGDAVAGLAALKDCKEEGAHT